MKIEHTITIQSPLENVFNSFTNLELAKEHIDGIKDIELLEGSAKMEKGTKWKETRELFGREETLQMWVSDMNKYNSYSIGSDANGAKYTTTFLFNENNGATDATIIFEGKPYTLTARLFTLFSFLFKGMTKKMLVKDMEEYKKIIETGE